MNDTVRIRHYRGMRGKTVGKGKGAEEEIKMAEFHGQCGQRACYNREDDSMASERREDDGNWPLPWTFLKDGHAMRNER